MAGSTFQFAGFSAPGYTQVPDEFFDVCLAHLSGAETKVMCYLLRRTFGWKKDSDAVSLSQITDGIVRRDGTTLDAGAGVSRETASNALKGLEQKGLIQRERTVRPDGGTGTTVYRIHFRGNTPQSENPTQPVRNPDPAPSAPTNRGIQSSDQPPVRESDPQDSGLTANNNHHTQDIWAKACETLAAQFTRVNFETYIAPLAMEKSSGRSLILRAPSAFVADWARSRFAVTIGAAVSNAAGRPLDVEFVVR